jgi:hypothetical protein
MLREALFESSLGGRKLKFHGVDVSGWEVGREKREMEWKFKGFCMKFDGKVAEMFGI